MTGRELVVDLDPVQNVRMLDAEKILRAVDFLSRYHVVLEAVAAAEARAMTPDVINATLRATLTAGNELDPDEREQVSRINSQLGTQRAAAHLGVSREAVLRVVAGLRVRRGTVVLVRRSLAVLPHAA